MLKHRITVGFAWGVVVMAVGFGVAENSEIGHAPPGTASRRRYERPDVCL
jgi:hypothetical protein